MNKFGIQSFLIFVHTKFLNFTKLMSGSGG